ncbi:MAG: transcription-repair coupling factor [bacterium]|nr:transcription-repair coupling factor [bacterium]
MEASSPGFPLPDLSRLLTQLDQGTSGLAIGGVVPEARALPVAALARCGWRSRPTLIVVPHLAESAQLAEGLRILDPSLNVGVVRGEGAGPYLGSEPPLAARLNHIRVLLDMAANRLDFVVAPVRALLAPVPNPKRVLQRGLDLAVGEDVDTSLLASLLAEAGYRRVDLVEEAGDFAVRGWVIDLHIGGEYPLRIELDGDRVETIQFFDAATQRRCEDSLERCFVPPLHFFADGETHRRQLVDRFGSEYQALTAMLRDGVERRLWWGLLHLADEAHSWSSLCSGPFVCDVDECLGEIERWMTVVDREWETLIRAHVPLPGPEHTLLEPEVLRAVLTSAALRIERIVVRNDELSWTRLATHPADTFVQKLPELVPTLRRRRAREMVQILTVGSEGERKRFTHLLKEGEVIPSDAPPPPGGVSLVSGLLEKGFLWEERLAVYGRRNLTAVPAPRRRRSGAGAFASDLRDLKPNDLIVHVDHGIGRFTGFRRVDVEGRQLEMLVLEYQRGDSLLVPVERADLIQRYGSGDGIQEPRLDRLGGTSWERRKSRVKKAVREMAAELLRLAAVRRAARGYRFSPDSTWQREFEDAFEYDLTVDQERAVEEIKADMENDLPMDRLLCGDVGYGKTEVAIRAAFKAVLDGKQVAILAPTTILVEQHLDTIRRRFTGFPVEIRTLSRFVKGVNAREVIEGMADGRVDIVIGTHRLLAGDIHFRDLGLVIVDEEQRFGVAQKERLKRLRTEVDLLSMSATPIPRTLNMALSGIRDISLIETPPRDRQAVETAILEFSEESVREAVTFEIERGGQVFVVHNRVRSIGAFAEWIRRVVPEARVVVAHGQMPVRPLEKAMRAFLDGEADVLLATAIIENGLDIPNANTLLVSRADRFGLAQLYQLRGRVGRSDKLGFAYFLVPPGQPLTPTARARLGAVQEFCELGSGFRIAARDLEIRGGGNMLGAEQHGFLEAVGFETYCKLLEEAVGELEGKPVAQHREVELRLGMDLQLPNNYIPEPALRLTFYKRLAGCSDDEQIDALIDEAVDRYGPPPPQLSALAMTQRVRQMAQQAGLWRIRKSRGQWLLEMDAESPGVANLGGVLDSRPGAQISPRGEVRVPYQTEAPVEDLLELVRQLAE